MQNINCYSSKSKNLALTFGKASVQPHTPAEVVVRCGSRNLSTLCVTCIIGGVHRAPWFCYSVTARTQLEDYQQRCWLVLVLQYNVLLLFYRFTNWWKISANLNSAGSGKDCISPLIRQLIVFLYVLNGKAGDSTTVSLLNDERVLV